MKAVKIMKPNDLRVIDMEKPVIDEKHNVLVKIRAAGICGSDVGIYHGKNAAATYPRVIGHEMVGDIVEVGQNGSKYQVGDRVIIDQVTSCGQCYACRKGRPNVCANLQVRGVHIDGGYREYMAVPESDCYRLPDFLSYEDAVMIEPTTIAVQACSRAQMEFDDQVLIIGAGALGSSILRIAKLYHPRRIIMADIEEGKLREAISHGADYAINSRTEDVAARAHELTEGYGPTVVIDAACLKGSFLTACRCAGNGGRVITMGFGVEPDDMNQFVITSKELDVRGSRLQNRKFQTVIDLIHQGQIDLSGSISHRFYFQDAKKAFDFNDTHDPSIRKIVLTFD
ncbi:MAG: zinc-binding alcohol dehydrogenase family protein [Lachnospiraceae bacterium]|jgi:2-desacetyl-2-hydroxyethyl bacteriochlorophyllide A dehydrogenase|nr:zinc-binding alcohol dehydrogenase family protein [Lachnospiraceae bacterium]